MDKSKIQIIVAAHKEFPMPDDGMYLPVQVGAVGHEAIGRASGDVWCSEPMHHMMREAWRSGRAIRYARDDDGENISTQNRLYSELTGLYWAWKNIAAEYIGLVHYRRYFKEPHPLQVPSGRAASEPLQSLKGELQWDEHSELQWNLQSVSRWDRQFAPQGGMLQGRAHQGGLMQSKSQQGRLQQVVQKELQDAALETGAEVLQWADIPGMGYDALEKSDAKADLRILRQLGKVLSYESLEPMLEETDIILPRLRNYRIETIYSHYAHTHCAEHLDVTRKIISERALSYLSTFDEVMQRRSAHMFNMMIMKRDRLDEYCDWLFPILEELVERVDSSGYDEYQARFAGRVSELLLDVWLGKCGYAYRELPVMMIGSKHLGKKAAAFLGAKFLGKRYEGSC